MPVRFSLLQGSTSAHRSTAYIKPAVVESATGLCVIRPSGTFPSAQSQVLRSLTYDAQVLFMSQARLDLLFSLLAIIALHLHLSGFLVSRTLHLESWSAQIKTVILTHGHLYRLPCPAFHSEPSGSVLLYSDCLRPVQLGPRSQMPQPHKPAR